MSSHSDLRVSVALVSVCLGCGVAKGANQTIQVSPGWNLISFQVEPSDSDVEAVLAEIAGSYDEIWAYDNQASPPVWDATRSELRSKR